MKWLCQQKGRKKKCIHTGLTSMAFPPHSQWSTLVSLPYKNTIKKQIKAATVIEELGLQRILYSRWGGTERDRQKETGREQRGWTSSLSWVSLDPCVSLDLFVLLCWGKVQLHGLVDFPVLLAHQLQRERAVQDLWGKMNTVILKKSMYDNLIVWIWLSDYTVQAWIKWHQTYCELVVCCRDVDGVLFFAGCLYVDGASLFVLAQFLQSQSDSQIFGEVVHCGVPRSLNVPDNKFHI